MPGVPAGRWDLTEAVCTLQDAVVARLKEVVDDFKELLPLVQELGNPALQPRHWQDIFDIIGADIPPNDSGIGRFFTALAACMGWTAWQSRRMTW